MDNKKELEALRKEVTLFRKMYSRALRAFHDLSEISLTDVEKKELHTKFYQDLGKLFIEYDELYK